LWDLFVLEGGSSRYCHVGGEKFELLVEKVNLVPAEALEIS
jgi:hypothetical protein